MPNFSQFHNPIFYMHLHTFLMQRNAMSLSHLKTMLTSFARYDLIEINTGCN